MAQRAGRNMSIQTQFIAKLSAGYVRVRTLPVNPWTYGVLAIALLMMSPDPRGFEQHLL